MEENRVSFLKSVLLTSLWSFLLAEFCFAIIYYIFINFIQYSQILFSFFTNSAVGSNSDFFGPINILFFLFGLIGVAFIAFLEMSTIVAITIYDRYRNDHIPLKSIFVFVFKKIKKLFSFKTFPLFILIMFFPKEHIGAEGLYTLEIPPFIMDGILSNGLYTGVFFILTFLAIYLVYKSLFIIHFLLLEDKNTFLDAFVKSSALTKRIGFLGIVKMFLFSGFLLFFILIPVTLILILFREFVIDFAQFFNNSGNFLITLISWLEKFLFLSIPGILFLATLTTVYIEKHGFTKENFSSNFNFIDEKQTVERWKNCRIIFEKFGKKGISFIVFFFICIFIFFSSFYIKVQPWEIQKLDIFAHRGYLYLDENEKFIENTIPAIENANSLGASMVEIDIFENKNGQLYLSHDINLKRIAKINKNIYDMSNEEINSIILPDGSKMPTLEEVFQLAKKKNIKLLLEPKIHGKEKNLYKTFVNLIQKYDMYELIAVHSLSLPSVLKIKEMDPKIKVGYTIFAGIGNLGAIPVDFFSIQETVLSRSLIENIHENGKKVYAWTVNDLDNLEKYIFMGIDGFITDELPLLKNDINKIQLKNQENVRYYLKFFSFKFLIPEF